MNASETLQHFRDNELDIVRDILIKALEGDEVYCNLNFNLHNVEIIKEKDQVTISTIFPEDEIANISIVDFYNLIKAE